MTSTLTMYLRSVNATRTLSRAFTASPLNNTASTLTAASYTTSTASSFSPSSLLSASTPSTPSSSSSSSSVQLSNITKPGGRQSINGVVATVFGASGFVGRYAVNYLGRIGSQVIVPYRGDGMNVRHLKLSGDLGQIVPMPCDLADEAQVLRALSRSNVVINLIGASQETTNFSYDDVHVKVAYRIAKLAKQAGVERFVHVSAVGASPKSTSSFFQSKFAGEEVVKSFYPNATILRPCTVYGPEDRFLNWIATIGQRFVALPTLNDGRQLLQPIHVHDVANAILQAVVDDKSLGKVYELGGPDVFTYANVVKLVSHSAFMDIKLASLPEPVLRLYGRLLGGRTYTYPEDAMFGAILSRVAQIASRVRFSGIYHEDLVDQALVNLVADPSLPGCKELDVTPTSLIAEIDQLMIPHRPIGVAPERFPDADKLKEKATPAGAFDRM